MNPWLSVLATLASGVGGSLLGSEIHHQLRNILPSEARKLQRRVLRAAARDARDPSFIERPLMRAGQPTYAYTSGPGRGGLRYRPFDRNVLRYDIARMSGREEGSAQYADRHYDALVAWMRQNPRDSPYRPVQSAAGNRAQLDRLDAYLAGARPYKLAPYREQEPGIPANVPEPPALPNEPNSIAGRVVQRRAGAPLAGPDLQRRLRARVYQLDAAEAEVRLPARAPLQVVDQAPGPAPAPAVAAPPPPGVVRDPPREVIARAAAALPAVPLAAPPAPDHQQRRLDPAEAFRVEAEMIGDYVDEPVARQHMPAAAVAVAAAGNGRRTANSSYQYVLGLLAYPGQAPYLYAYVGNKLFGGNYIPSNAPDRAQRYAEFFGNQQFQSDREENPTIADVLFAHCGEYYGLLTVSSTLGRNQRCDVLAASSRQEGDYQVYDYTLGYRNPYEYPLIPERNSPRYVTEVPRRSEEEQLLYCRFALTGPPFQLPEPHPLYEFQTRFGYGRIGRQVSGKFLTINGLLIGAKYMYAAPPVSQLADAKATSYTNQAPVVTNLALNQGWTIGERMPGNPHTPLQIVARNLATVHRVVAVAVAVTSTFDPRSLFTPLGSQVPKSSRWGADHSAISPDPDIFCARDPSTIGEVEVLYDKTFHTTVNEPTLLVRHSIQLNQREFHYSDNDALNQARGVHVVVVHAAYVPDMPTPILRTLTIRRDDGRLAGVVNGVPTGADMTQLATEDAQLGPYFPNVIPGRFRFSTNFVYED